MTLLTGITEAGQEVPVQVKGDGRLVAEGLTGPAGPNQVAAGTSASPSISFAGYRDTGIYSPGADQVAISSNGVGRLFIDASGRVGIGTTSPSVPLTIQADSNAFGTDIIGRAADNTSIIRFKTTDNATALGSIGQYGATMNIATVGAGPIAFYTNNTERGCWDSSGRFSVGTVNAPAGAPAGSVTAKGGVYLQSPNGTWFAVGVSDAGQLSVTQVALTKHDVSDQDPDKTR